MRITLLAAVVFLLSFPASAQDRQAFLLQFQGNWSGSGQSRTGPEEPYVPAQCSFIVEWTRQGLRSDGSCSGARRTFAAGGVVRLDGEALSGTFMAPYFGPPVRDEIHIEAGRPVAYATYEIDEIEYSFRVQLSPPVNGIMEMRSHMLVEGVYQDVAQVTLRAQ